jgi:hypothetical protein
MTEFAILNKRGKCSYKNYEYNYDIDSNFPEIYKPIIKEVEDMNEKTNY